MNDLIIDGETRHLTNDVIKMIDNLEIILVKNEQINEELLKHLGFVKTFGVWSRNQNFVEIFDRNRNVLVSIDGHQNYIKNAFFISVEIYEKFFVPKVVIKD